MSSSSILWRERVVGSNRGLISLQFDTHHDVSGNFRDSGSSEIVNILLQTGKSTISSFHCTPYKTDILPHTKNEYQVVVENRGEFGQQHLEYVLNDDQIPESFDLNEETYIVEAPVEYSVSIFWIVYAPIQPILYIEGE